MGDEMREDDELYFEHLVNHYNATGHDYDPGDDDNYGAGGNDNNLQPNYDYNRRYDFKYDCVEHDFRTTDIGAARLHYYALHTPHGYITTTD